MAKGTGGESCQGPSPVSKSQLSHTGSGLKQHVSKGGTCNPMHLTHENKTKIKLSPPRLEGTQSPLQPCSGIVRNPVPPASQWEYTAVGFPLVHFVIRSLEFAHATGLQRSGLVSIPSPKLLLSHGGHGWVPPPRSPRRQKGHWFIQQHKMYLKHKPAHLTPSDSITKVGSLK